MWIKDGSNISGTRNQTSNGCFLLAPFEVLFSLPNMALYETSVKSGKNCVGVSMASNMKMVMDFLFDRVDGEE